MQVKAGPVEGVQLTPFIDKVGFPLRKKPIEVLQINLGKRCNLACTHCHVEAGPQRTEELSPELCYQLIEMIRRFGQIKTIDLTGGAPEMLYGFKPLVEAARGEGKEVIVRSNLTIYFERGYEDMPEYCAHQGVRIVASLPCYLEDNVDKMRGRGVYDASIRALRRLNALGYGSNPDLILDLVYNPQLPTGEKFSLPPAQAKLEKDYHEFLLAHFGIKFNRLLTITNLPIGRTKLHLKRRNLSESYLHFLEANYNGDTVEPLMCRSQLSIDYLGNVYDCDFNQMEGLRSRTPEGTVTVGILLAKGSLDVIEEVETAAYCYGCTAGCGSSCGGALV
ncbi:MAG TPA: arsenosugar biosynthesis radical SAM protein ArsS [Oscillatoriaceae cyanobacterium M33_DOE_052]|uniref:Radical SAM/Cys-rich domain protein n=1 Tax=Planktothricoides sp. SpSt-374 TaxID=2282167 RepID=A0A7C3ZUC6_9CYAN|nr:arsenosugar biosynthesis radical SAM protein ArsS [Oscillatoriaceae cyanobacterium M33_DOE_052]